MKSILSLVHRLFHRTNQQISCSAMTRMDLVLQLGPNTGETTPTYYWWKCIFTHQRSLRIQSKFKPHTFPLVATCYFSIITEEQWTKKHESKNQKNSFPFLQLMSVLNLHVLPRQYRFCKNPESSTHRLEAKIPRRSEWPLSSVPCNLFPFASIFSTSKTGVNFFN